MDIPLDSNDGQHNRVSRKDLYSSGIIYSCTWILGIWRQAVSHARRFPIESKGRRKKLHEVGSVTAICFTCFLIRCFMVGLSAFDAEASLVVLDHPILDLIYYMLTEILPSALVLYILRKLPPKRVSGQYHPIR
ncbi:hypothetical protein C4D60_Mb10t19430 [Musa balbisiana]|uniref:THH1/TOM1/TOM3 domain-containing protein n=1 Tax=Musa balbisiana TaxID=52838 RepID=A0A4S8IYD6_MUSBA|nr:hypothetical protein C4D60_Mb10t19430 [Musa balbisiana]